MAEPHHPGHTSHGKFSFSVWLSVILVNVCYLIKDESLRQIAITLSPPASFVIVFLCKYGLKEFQHFRACKIINGEILKIEEEIKIKGTSKARKSALRDKADELKSELKNRKLSNLDIQIK